MCVSFVSADLAYPKTLQFLGKKLLEWRVHRAGYVFLFARSPEAPRIVMTREQSSVNSRALFGTLMPRGEVLTIANRFP